MPTPPQPRLFISHSHRDKEAVTALRKALDERGLRCFEDVRDLRIRHLELDLEREVRQARGLVLYLTRGAVQSEWVPRELRWARVAQERAADERRAYPIVVVRALDDELVVAVPEWAGVGVHIDHTGPPADAATAIMACLEGAAAPALPSRPVQTWAAGSAIHLADARPRPDGSLELRHEDSAAWTRLPLGQLELRRLDWYVGTYPQWPLGTALDEAAAVESQLDEWGAALRQTLGVEGPAVDLTLVPSLAEIPWELAVPDLVRVAPGAAGRARIGFRLRVLLWLSTGDEAQRTTGAADIAHALAELADKVELEAALDDDAARQALARRRWDLVHVHGQQPAAGAGEPLAAAVVVLDAGGPSLAGAWIGRGASAVVALPPHLPATSRSCFLDALYRALVAGRSLRTAVQSGREALRDRGMPHTWFVPTLTLAGPDAALLPAGRLPDPTEAAWLRDARLAATPPLPAHGLHGRDRELVRIARALNQGQGQGQGKLLAVTGRGGEGKSALASAAARWLLDLGLIDRVAWVRARRTATVDDLVDGIAFQIVSDWRGRAVEPASGPGSMAHQVQWSLRDWRVLVVLDELELVSETVQDGVRDQLKAWTQGTGSRVLVTTRQRSAATSRLDLDPLPLDAALALVAGLSPEEDRAAALALVEVVGRHARSLVLLAPHVGSKGYRETAARVEAEIAAMSGSQPDQSLVASLRVSVDLLDPATVAHLPVVAACGVVVPRAVLGAVCELADDELDRLLEALEEVGIAHVTEELVWLEPALPVAFPVEDAQARLLALSRWANAWVRLLWGLNQALHGPKRRAQYVALEAGAEMLRLVELLADWTDRGWARRDLAVEAAGLIEALFGATGRLGGRERLAALRERLAAPLSGWSHATFDHQRRHLEGLMEQGRILDAVESAERLVVELDRHASSYALGPFDRATAKMLLGRALNRASQPSRGAAILEQAEELFEGVSVHQPELSGAPRMVYVCRTERADSYRELGKLDQAATLYKEGIEAARARDDRRAEAVNSGQLGTIRILQGRAPEAATLWEAVGHTFEEIGEPRMVAAAYHQQGLAWRLAGEITRSERAYLAAIEIAQRHGYRGGLATHLDDLALTYGAAGRHADAVRLHRQALELRRGLGDRLAEARTLSNLALAQLDLGDLEAAEAAIGASASLETPFGARAEPWKTAEIQAMILRRRGKEDQALSVRRAGLKQYLAWRRDGGPGGDKGRVVDHWLRRLETGTGPRALLAELTAQDDLHPDWQSFFERARQVLSGSTPDLDRLDLPYDEVASLTLLAEALGVTPGTRS